jgi:uncharacterized protein YoxC
METIIAAVISAAAAIIVCVISNRAQAAKTLALIKYEVESLRGQVEKHNKIVERTYQLEGRMNEAEHDIRDLKCYHKPQ